MAAGRSRPTLGHPGHPAQHISPRKPAPGFGEALGRAVAMPPAPSPPPPEMDEAPPGKRPRPRCCRVGGSTSISSPGLTGGCFLPFAPAVKPGNVRNIIQHFENNQHYESQEPGTQRLSTGSFPEDLLESDR